MNRKILRLAIPNIISNLSVPLLGAVDTALVGHLEEVYYLGALAVGSVIFNFIFWGFGFLRMGTTGLTAQEYGRRDRVKMMMILARVQFLALLIGLAILLLQSPIAMLSLWLIDSTQEVAEYTRVYYDIRILTAPGVLALYGINGWFLGMQNAKFPMIITIVLNMLNIAFNVWFIYGLGMHVDGVAWGTLVSTYLALLLAIFLFLKRYKKHLTDYKQELLLNVEELKKYFSVNRDIFIRTLCLIFAFSFFTAVSAKQGDLILAANTILLQLWFIVSYGIDGFAYAAESLVGRFKGSLEENKLTKAVWYNIGWGLFLGVMGSLAYALFGNQILYIFTDKADVIAVAKSVLFWTILAPLVSSFCYILDGVYIGATETKPMRNTMIVATFLVFLPTYYGATYLFGKHGLWLAMVLFMITRGVALGVYLPKTVLEK
ncbi:MATE family efflux transporter [Rhodohalobacter sulfatireducens]|uniref:MATE family efflux transporter n=1 Tax=Rhodohalobacter sulfatireducens TaxID=2911366 RepID=A0ABS9KFJ0_9BACT|nr:MATE family efflux transporter [Rhodohalobacter sulfatireducens]MCG2589630.1 MATE family efflux transporter [Rhodohalobacter sulfatireducens]